jgi:integrase
MTATRVKPTTLYSYRRNLEIHVLPALGGKLLQQITATMLNTLYADLASPSFERRELSAKTISYIHAIVHKALSDAVDADLVMRNAAERAKPPRPSRRSTGGIRSWNADELRSFLVAVEGSRLEAVWRLAAMTGMRRGEILGLRWSDLDLDAARLAVRQALVTVGYSVIKSTPKSHGARVIDLDARTVRQLSTVGASRTSEPSGELTTKITTWWWPRRTANRSTLTRSASPSNGSSSEPG